MIIATAGHVDHGKTSLVRALTGVDTDRLPEEKRRGMTIDLGFAYINQVNQALHAASAHLTQHPPTHRADGAAARQADGAAAGAAVSATTSSGAERKDRADAATGTLGFIDVPGHERFVHNMLAGVAGIDCALLVIAADDGPMPQTLEHLAILDLLGVRTGVVALTKIDAVDAARVSEVTQAISQLLASTALAAAPIFPLSSITGAGLPALREHLDGLRHTVRATRLAARGGRFRMTVDRAFTVAGAGLVVTGTVLAGAVQAGDEVQALLAGARSRVRGLHAQNRAAPRAVAGERCALNLAGAGVSHTSIVRGDWITAAVTGASAAPAATRIDIRLRVLASEARPLKHWTPVHVHIGAANVTGRVALLDAESLAPGASGLAQLVCAQPIGACHGDAVILRDQSARRTLGGGSVIDVFAPPRGRARPARLAFLHAMANVDHAAALSAALAALPQGLALDQFAACRNLTSAEFNSLAANSGMVRATDAVGFAPAHWQAARQAALGAVTAWHARSPSLPGIPEDHLLDGTGVKLAPAVRAALGAALVASGALARSGATLKLPGHNSGLQGADQVLWERLRAVLEAEGERPPTAAEVALTLKTPVRSVKALLVRAAQQHMAWRVSEERFALPATVHAWAAHASALAGPAREQRFKATDFRDRSGVGRNLTIEILEFFDRVKFTRRMGDVRMLQAAARDIFGVSA